MPPVPQAYRKEDEETDELILMDDECADVDPEYLPRRLLTDFSIYNAEVGGAAGLGADAVYCCGTVVMEEGSLGSLCVPLLVLVEGGGSGWLVGSLGCCPGCTSFAHRCPPLPLRHSRPQGMFGSLELLPMWSGVDPDVELYASGLVVDDEGDFSGGQALNDGGFGAGPGWVGGGQLVGVGAGSAAAGEQRGHVSRRDAPARRLAAPCLTCCVYTLADALQTARAAAAPVQAAAAPARAALAWAPPSQPACACT